MSTKHLRRLITTATILLLGQFAVAPAAKAQVATARPQARILQKVDSNVRTTFAKSTPAAITRATDQGRLDPNTQLDHMVLVLKSSDAQETALRTLVDQQHDKGTASFHKWLTPDQFGAAFGVADSDIQKINTWLQSQGFSIDSVAKGKRLIAFSGTSGQVENAFHTSMHRYSVNGVSHISNSTDLSIPAAFKGVVKSAPSLHDFMSKPDIGPLQHLRMGADGNLQPDPNYPNAELRPGRHFVSPGDFAKIYNTTPSGADGSGVTIGIVGRSDILLSDVQTYRRAFHLPDNDPTILSVGVAPGHTDAELEADLDVEESGAIAPMAKILYAPAALTLTIDGVDLSAFYFVDNNNVDIISESFGNCELNTGAFYGTLWEQAAAQGQSVFVSSGDSGAFTCDQNNTGVAIQGLAVSGIASTPFNTAVGGTQFAEGTGNDAKFWAPVADQTAGYVSALGYIPEAGWDEGEFNGGFALDATGGGISTVFGRPSWQMGSGIDATLDPRDVGQGPGLHRLVPDVSFNAAGHDATLVCYGGACQLDSNGNLLHFGAVGGTSVAAPGMAGVQALIDQKNGGRQGLGNYYYYQLSAAQNAADCNSTGATAPKSTCVFNDVTTGSNREFIPGLPGANDGFDAGSGYDEVTGLGSINVSNLISKWSTVKFNSTTTSFSITPPTTTTHDKALNVSIAVAAASGTVIPTGDVTILADAPYGSVGFFTLGADGTASGALTGLPGGTYTVVARYSGDGTFASSTSAPVTVTIGAEDSQTSATAYSIDSNGHLTPHPATVQFGQTIAINAFVQSNSGNGVATGKLTFTDNGKPLTTLPLNSIGQVSLVAGPPPASIASFFPQNTPAFGVGNHVIVTTYSGDNGLNPSTAAPPITFAVTAAAQGINLTTSAVQITSGASVILTATIPNVNAIPATGSVTFFDGTTSLGTAPLKNNTATLTTTAITTAGANSITAQYPGDTNYAPATSAPVNINVGPGLSSPVTLTLSTPTAVLNQTVTYTVNVPAVVPNPAPTGTVNLYDGTVLFASGTLDATGTAVINSNVPAAGVHSITAVYSGDPVYVSTTSAPSTLTVSKSPTTLALSSKSMGVFGEQTALVARLTTSPFGPLPNLPTASVTFLDGTTVLGTAPLTINPVSGLVIATFTTNMLGGGTHNITATFAGDANYTASTSNVQTIAITPAPTATTLTLSAPSVIQGQSLTLTAAVTGAIVGLAPPTGTVSFFDGTTLLGTSPVDGSGMATLMTSFLTNGPHILTAMYSGDANYAPSTSANATENVTPAFTLSADPSSLTVKRGDNGFVAIIVTAAQGFSGTVALSCTNLPANAACQFIPASASVANGSSQTIELILKAHVPVNPIAALQNPGTDGGMLPAIPALAFWLPGAALSGFGLGRKRTARQRHMLLLAVFALGLVGMVGLAGCGSGNGVEAAPGTYNINVVGTSGNITNSVPLTLTVK